MAKTIIHVFNGQVHHHVKNMIQDTVEFFGANGSYDHVFYVYKYNQFSVHYRSLISENKILLKELKDGKQLAHLIKSLEKNQKLIIHGIVLKELWIWLYTISKANLNKVTWVCWGAGVNWLPGVRGVVLNYMRRVMYNRIGNIIALMQPDCKSLKEKFHCKNVIVSPYYSRMCEFEYHSFSRVNKNIYPIRIKVGNNAGGANNHLKSFELLQNFAEQDIKIITPLGYGNEANRQNILECGKKLFGAKYTPLTDLLTQDEYISYLYDNVDILLYHAEIQLGLFNIYTCLNGGKKLYLNGINYEWIKHLGFHVYHVNDIKSFEEFATPLTQQQMLRNRTLLHDILGNRTLIRNWKKIFDT